MNSEESIAASDELEALLAAFKTGRIDGEETARQIRAQFYRPGSYSTRHRSRTAHRISGSSFWRRQTAGQISDILAAMVDRGTSVLVTRLDQATFDQLKNVPANAQYHAMSQLLWWHDRLPQPLEHTVAVVSAGTSDMHVAEEAALTAEFYGNNVQRIYDVGVAGLHRLLARLDELRSARVLIVVAGMEGALPSVVGGLVDKPIIAVPTSVGYGAAFDGVAALLGMMTSCASGVSVVNIDNGFGAGFLANRINRL